MTSQETQHKIEEMINRIGRDMGSTRWNGPEYVKDLLIIVESEAEKREKEVRKENKNLVEDFLYGLFFAKTAWNGVVQVDAHDVNKLGNELLEKLLPTDHPISEEKECVCHCHATNPTFRKENPCSKFDAHCLHCSPQPLQKIEPEEALDTLNKALEKTGYKFDIRNTKIDFDGKTFTINGSPQPLHDKEGEK